MKIPKSIRIAGHDVRVLVVKKFKEHYKGESYANKNLVRIARESHGQPFAKDQISSTLLHEIIHQIDDKYDIGLSEKKLRKLETGLFQVLRDNDLDFRKRG